MLSDCFNQDINALFQDSEIKVYLSSDKYWFPTPEKWKYHLQHLIAAFLMKSSNWSQGKSNPIPNAHDRKMFLLQLPWKNSTFNAGQKRTVENLLLTYHHIFTHHRFDTCRNDDFKVKLNPENSELFYTQGPTPIHYRDEVLIEIAILQYWGVITTNNTKLFKIPHPTFCRSRTIRKFSSASKFAPNKPSFQAWQW